MAFVDRPWDGSEGRFSIEQWRSSCLIDTGKGDPDTKERYKLPVKEPNGDYNKGAIRNARARLNQVDAPASEKAKAQKRLDALAKQAGIGQ
jgi:hypothetical protein